MSENFNYQPDELFGRYCLIEQKRYGVPNEKFLYKVIRTLNSSAWGDIPVDSCDKEFKLHDHCEQVVDVICCGVSEDKVERYKLSDIELLPSKQQSQLDQQKVMWNELKEWLEEEQAEIQLAGQYFDTKETRLLSDYIDDILERMQELEGEDE